MTSSPVHDTTVLTGRTLRHVTRSPDTIVTTAVMPIAIMLLFVGVFGGAIRTGPRTGGYVDYMLPGIVLITVAMGVSYTGYRLFTDLERGVVDRFHSLPVWRGAVLWAHVLTSLASNLLSVVIVVLVAVALGFRTGAGPAAWLAVAGLVGLFTLALTWVAVLAGLSAHSVEGATAFSYPLIFLPFVSSAFVPTETMSAPVRWFAEHQPATPVVETIRRLWEEQPVGDQGWVAVAWCAAILAVACPLALRRHRSRIR